jgi:hypothetical protein
MPVCAAKATLKLCPAPVFFRHQHGRHEVLAETAQVFWHADAEQPQFPGFYQQALHQAFFHVSRCAPRWVHTFCSRNSRSALRDHLLFLVEFLGNEDVLRCAFADQELAALEGFFVSVLMGEGQMIR